MCEVLSSLLPRSKPKVERTLDSPLTEVRQCRPRAPSSRADEPVLPFRRVAVGDTMERRVSCVREPLADRPLPCSPKSPSLIFKPVKWVVKKCLSV